VSFGDYSIELCGGTHITNTAQIGSFYIVKESGVSAGVRRIEAVVSLRAVEYMNSFRSSVEALENELKNKDLLQGVAKLKAEIKELKTAITKVQSGAKADIKSEVINGVALVVDEFVGDAKAMIDEIKNRHEKVAVMLFVTDEDKISVTAGVKGLDINAGEWLKTVCAVMDGKGGGRADFASGSGKEKAKLEEAKTSALEFVKSKI
jgi:alanyl-tRNA synthetase